MDKVIYAYNKGYIVSKEGEVFYKGKKRKLMLVSNKCKYFCFSLRKDGVTIKIKVHRLQAYQKYGDKIFNEGVVVRHLDGNSLNNHYENIAIGTQQENVLDIPKEIRIKSARYASSFTQKYNHDEVYEFYSKCRSYKTTMEKFDIKSKNGLYFILKKMKKSS